MAALVIHAVKQRWVAELSAPYVEQMKLSALSAHHDLDRVVLVIEGHRLGHHQPNPNQRFHVE